MWYVAQPLLVLMLGFIFRLFEDKNVQRRNKLKKNMFLKFCISNYFIIFGTLTNLNIFRSKSITNLMNSTLSKSPIPPSTMGYIFNKISNSVWTCFALFNFTHIYSTTCCDFSSCVHSWTHIWLLTITCVQQV